MTFDFLDQTYELYLYSSSLDMASSFCHLFGVTEKEFHTIMINEKESETKTRIENFIQETEKRKSWSFLEGHAFHIWCYDSNHPQHLIKQVGKEVFRQFPPPDKKSPDIFNLLLEITLFISFEWTKVLGK